jgi:two-component system, cell cycle sensor histidine kinase and response regulator CckA
MPVITESANAVTKSLRPAKTIVVMLVEDDDSVRRVAGEILTTAGYTILQAKNGQEALLLAERKAAAISVLIADVIMPEMSGPDVAKRLLRLHPQLRTIFISGYPENVLRNRQVVPNASYLRKPFSVEALMRAVSKAAGT